jgi:hypothetical protein
MTEMIDEKGILKYVYQVNFDWWDKTKNNPLRYTQYLTHQTKFSSAEFNKMCNEALEGLDSIYLFAVEDYLKDKYGFEEIEPYLSYSFNEYKKIRKD